MFESKSFHQLSCMVVRCTSVQYWQCCMARKCTVVSVNSSGNRIVAEWQSAAVHDGQLGQYQKTLLLTEAGHFLLYL